MIVRFNIVLILFTAFAIGRIGEANAQYQNNIPMEINKDFHLLLFVSPIRIPGSIPNLTVVEESQVTVHSMKYLPGRIAGGDPPFLGQLYILDADSPSVLAWNHADSGRSSNTADYIDLFRNKRVNLVPPSSGLPQPTWEVVPFHLYEWDMKDVWVNLAFCTEYTTVPAFPQTTSAETLVPFYVETPSMGPKLLVQVSYENTDTSSANIEVTQHINTGNVIVGQDSVPPDSSGIITFEILVADEEEARYIYNNSAFSARVLPSTNNNTGGTGGNGGGN